MDQEPSEELWTDRPAGPPSAPPLGPRPGAPSGPMFTDPVPQPAVAPVATGPGPMVVVTGPSGPLGRAIRAALCRRGCLVAAVGATADGALDGAPVLELEGDLGSAEQVDRAAEFVRRTGEAVIGMVHVVAPGGPSSTAGDDPVLAQLDTEYLRGLRGPVQLARRLLEPLAATAARVVVVHPEPAPAGATALPDALRAEFARRGITVCSVGVSAPGTVDAASSAALGDLVADTVLGRDGLDVVALHARLR